MLPARATETIMNWMIMYRKLTHALAQVGWASGWQTPCACCCDHALGGMALGGCQRRFNETEQKHCFQQAKLRHSGETVLAHGWMFHYWCMF